MSFGIIELVALACLVVVAGFQAVSSTKVMQDAWIWPGLQRIGIHLTFSDTADWSDLSKLKSSKGFYTVGKFCVRGSFIMYDEPSFHISRPRGFEIVSGDFRCLNISDNTKSIQLVGSMGHMNGPSITFFDKRNFASFAYPTTLNVGSQFFQRMGSIRSAIIVGKIPWALQFSSGETFCVKPDFDPGETRPICLINDFRMFLDDAGNFSSRLERATEGCKTDIDQESIYKIQDCQYWGRPSSSKTGNLLDDEEPKMEGRSSLLKLPDKITCSSSEDSKWLFQLYKLVISNSASSSLIIEWPKPGKQAWKLELLDWIFTLVKAVIPDELIPTIFLNHVRELFVDKLAKHWNKPGQNVTDDVTLIEKQYFNLLKLSENCVKLIKRNVTEIREQFDGSWNSIHSVIDFKDRIDPEFERRLDLDVIPELVWIAGHMTGFICHQKYMLKSHFWAIFFQAFRQLYVEPLTSEWKTPTKALNIILGGIDYNLEYNKLAMFATIARKMAVDMEPLLRPDFTQEPE